MSLPINEVSSVSRYSNNVTKSPVSLDPCSNAKNLGFLLTVKYWSQPNSLRLLYLSPSMKLVSAARREEKCINKAEFMIDLRKQGFFL